MWLPVQIPVLLTKAFNLFTLSFYNLVLYSPTHEFCFVPEKLPADPNNFPSPHLAVLYQLFVYLFPRYLRLKIQFKGLGI